MGLWVKKLCGLYGNNSFEVFKFNKFVYWMMVKESVDSGGKPQSENAMEDFGSKGENNIQNMPLSIFGWLGLLFSVFCWGLSFPLLKIALEEIEPITLAVIRYVIAVIPLLIFMIAKNGKNSFIKPLKEDFWFFVCLSLVGITLPNVFQNYGMTMTSAHLSSIIQASGPVFTIIMAVILLKEAFGWAKIAGTLIALSGTFLLVTGGGLDLQDSTVLGNLLVLISAFSYAFSSIMSKKILEKYDPITVATMTMFLGTLILAVFMITESPHQRIPQISVNGWILVITLAVLPGAAALLVWYKILRTTELSRIILFIYLIPVFATAIAYVWPGEIIQPTTILFAALIVCGVLIAQYEKRKKEGILGK
jgi:drug/metabolite transporter (DMT)-like permease